MRRRGIDAEYFAAEGVTHTKRLKRFDYGKPTASAHPAMAVAGSDEPAVPIAGTQQESEMAALLPMVEWWGLAQADVLLSARGENLSETGSSFSNSAAWWSGRKPRHLLWRTIPITTHLNSQTPAGVAVRTYHDS